MEKEKLNHTFQRTEEVRDIIDRMPMRTGQIVAALVFLLGCLFLILGWQIEYPETVSGPVSITSRQAPVRLVSIIPGKLHLLKNNGVILTENEIIAYMENPAKLEDILSVERFLAETRVNNILDSTTTIVMPQISSLGELNSIFFSFCNAYEKFKQYQTGQPFEKKRLSLASQLNGQLQLAEHNFKQLEAKEHALAIASKKNNRDSILYKTATIAEADMDNSAIGFLGQIENIEIIKKEKASLQLQISDTRHKLKLLEIEQQQEEQQLNMGLITTYNELENSVKKWKQQYLYISPFAGTLDYLNFWRENDFIPAGIETFSVLPANNPLLGQIYLPAHGAGKVEAGQKVIIKLENYPYLEYGSIDGQVKSISMVNNQAEVVARQNNIHTYLVTVDLPNNLTTNYGATLNFSYEIKGMADIVTKPRQLLDRLFDNLKYIASKK